MTRLTDVAGQDDAVARLESLLEGDRFPHALLLEGPARSGKMSIATILARILLCRTPSRNPAASCDQCPSCIKLDGQNHADFHVVTTDAKQIKIGEIRDACQALNLRPMEGTRKILIIEDADRMNPQAQNALLKTLEEPPGATHIMLTVTRLRNILPTVVSRCQRLALAPVPTDRVAQILADKTGLSPEAAQLTAALADGSLGRALEMDLEETRTRRDRIATLDREVSPQGPRGAVAALDQATELASDRTELLESLALLQLWLRDQMLIAAGVTTPQLANLDRAQELTELAETRGLAMILHRIRDVDEARRQLELPYNYNALMITEQLCLALAGEGRLDRI